MRSVMKLVAGIVLSLVIVQAGCVNIDTSKSKPKDVNAPAKYQGDKSYYSPYHDDTQVGPGNTDYNTELTK